MTAELAPLLPPRRRQQARVRLTPAQYVERYHRGRRVDHLVLLDLARHADYNPVTWGEKAMPRVGDKGRGETTVGERIGYSERSVQYALRRLEREGWVERREQAGRVSIYRIVRKVEPVGAVDTEPETVDDVGDNRPPEAASVTLAVARRGATVAPDLEHPPTDRPPKPPDRGSGEVDGASRRLSAAPRAPRGGRAPTGTPPPPSAGVVAEPHRRMRGPSVVPGRAAPSLVSPPQLPIAAHSDEQPVERASRWVTRETRRCPRCAAPPGESCRGPTGKLRRANHAERRPPRL